MLKSGDISTTVQKAFNETKGHGTRKLRHHMNEKYVAISENRIRNELERSEAYQRVQARFTNRPIHKPITARSIQTRHQIDVVSMLSSAINYQGKKYKYVLTVLDVFSRYLWTRPLQSKKSKEIAHHLKSIYEEHGPPRVIQHDRGKEFDGSVEQLMRHLNVKIIRSRPYHPQSQGKVERSHRTLKQKMLFDLVRKQRRAANWVEALPLYTNIMNNAVREELGYRTPFQVYYGRRDNQIVHKLGSRDPSTVRYERYLTPNATGATKNDLSELENERSEVRASVVRDSERCNQRMVNRGVKKHPPSVYNIGEKVLVRVRHPRKKPKSMYTVRGTILERRLSSARYKIQYTATKGNSVTEWFSVENVTSVTIEKEKRRKKMSSIGQRTLKKGKTRMRGSLNRCFQSQRFYILRDRGDWLDRYGFRILEDPRPNGDCQFSAVASQLATIGIHRSATTLRSEVVESIRRNPALNDGTPLALFIGRNNLRAYTDSMGANGTFGDHITLQRMADLFNVQFIVFSSLGPTGTRIISPTGFYDENIPVLFLGHEAEGRGEHYYSVQGDNASRNLAISMFEYDCNIENECDPIQYNDVGRDQGDKEDEINYGNSQNGSGNEEVDRNNGVNDEINIGGSEGEREIRSGNENGEVGLGGVESSKKFRMDRNAVINSGVENGTEICGIDGDKTTSTEGVSNMEIDDDAENCNEDVGEDDLARENFENESAGVESDEVECSVETGGDKRSDELDGDENGDTIDVNKNVNEEKCTDTSVEEIAGNDNNKEIGGNERESCKKDGKEDSSAKATVAEEKAEERREVCGSQDNRGTDNVENITTDTGVCGREDRGGLNENISTGDSIKQNGYFSSNDNSGEKCLEGISGGNDTALINADKNDANASVPCLPPEVHALIIEAALKDDVRQALTLSMVSSLYHDIVTSFLYKNQHLITRHQRTVHIRHALAEQLHLSHNNPTTISVRRVLRTSGHHSGLSNRIRELLKEYGGRWYNAWITLEPMSKSGMFRIIDVTWKK